MPGDQYLAETVRNNWIRNNPDTDLDFENFLMQGMDREWNNISVVAAHLNLLRSDHSQFWIINNKNFFSSLPAILLSDLGPYRGYMRDCYHAPCDNFNITSKNINWKFYSHTVQALIGRTAVGDIPLILSLSQTPWSSSQAPSAAHRGTWAKRASGTTQRFSSRRDPRH